MVARCGRSACPPARVDPEKVAAHVAVRTLVTPTELTHAVPGFVIEVVDAMERRSGRARMIASQLRVRSALTEAATTWCFAGLYLGEQHVTGGVRPPPTATSGPRSPRSCPRRSRPPTCSRRSA